MRGKQAALTGWDADRFERIRVCTLKGADVLAQVSGEVTPMTTLFLSCSSESEDSAVNNPNPHNLSKQLAALHAILSYAEFSIVVGKHSLTYQITSLPAKFCSGKIRH